MVVFLELSVIFAVDMSLGCGSFNSILAYSVIKPSCHPIEIYGRQEIVPPVKLGSRFS